jgi:hypothetical protein
MVETIKETSLESVVALKHSESFFKIPDAAPLNELLIRKLGTYS